MVVGGIQVGTTVQKGPHPWRPATCTYLDTSAMCMCRSSTHRSSSSSNSTAFSRASLSPVVSYLQEEET